MSDLKSYLVDHLKSLPKKFVLMSGHGADGAISADTVYDLSYALSFILQSLWSGNRELALGIHIERSVLASALTLSAALAGIKIVPLNPKFPKNRLEYIASAANVTCILSTDATFWHNYPDCPVFGVKNLNDVFKLSDLHCSNFNVTNQSSIAYHMFTSGSTGVPKGVPVSGNSLLSYLKQAVPLISADTGDSFSHVYDLSFDLAMHDIFVAFLSGGELKVASDFDLYYPAKYLASSEINHWFSVPSLGWRLKEQLIDNNWVCSVKTLCFCGEALPAQLAHFFYLLLDKNKSNLINLYGPTEATIACCYNILDKAPDGTGCVSIGRPFANTQAALIDHDRGNIIPIDHVGRGELLLSGNQVFSGYFPVSPDSPFCMYKGQTYYKSGDLVKSDGKTLEFLGRLDSQIKLNGHRIDLGEIDAAARQIFPNHQVCALQFYNNDQNHIGLAVEGEEVQFNTDLISELIPSYMVPKKIKFLPAFPLNDNGKIDRKKLVLLFENENF